MSSASINIGLLQEPGPGLALSLLSVIRSGNCFVPLHTQLPDERILFIIKDCNLRILLTDETHYPRISNLLLPLSDSVQVMAVTEKMVSDLPDPSQDSTANVSPDANCYIVYTSGTTGNPKGVPISHANLSPLLQWAPGYFGLNERSKVLQLLPFAFDFGIFEYLTTLLSGGTLYFAPLTVFPDKAGFRDYLVKKNIDTFHTTPSYFNYLVNTGLRFPGLKILHLGGEKLTYSDIEKMRYAVGKDCRIFNGYGPTETTINTTIFEILTAPGGEMRVPVGRPSANNEVFILDEFNMPCPPGIAGELYIGGKGVSKGYWKEETLSASRFIPNPLTRKGLVYRTGDSCMWSETGEIEFLGRKDNQLKINGYRIEAGEIEHQLLQFPGIRQVHVGICSTEFADALIAWYISDQQNISQHDLRLFLHGKLPPYMIPAEFIPTDTFPLTATSKIDSRLLPIPTANTSEDEKEGEEPQTATESSLAHLWQELLSGKKVGRHHHFFLSGGNSIMAIQLTLRIQKELSRRLDNNDVFLYPVLKDLAARVDACPSSAYTPIAASQEEGPFALSHAQRRLWILSQLEEQNRTFNLAGAFLIPAPLDKTAMNKTLTILCQRHELFRTRFSLLGEEPRQWVSPLSELNPVVEYVLPDSGTDEQLAERIFIREGMRPFDLDDPPLFRCIVIGSGTGSFYLCMVIHHIIADGWSVGLLLREFISLYKTLLNGEQVPETAPSLSYRDYVRWQQQQLLEETMLAHGAYWRKKFSKDISRLDLPSDAPRPAIPSFEGATGSRIIPPQLNSAIREYTREKDISLFMFFNAVLAALLVRYTGQHQLVIGTPVAGRDHLQLEEQTGLYINVLPLLFEVDGEGDFGALVAAVKTECLESFAHRQYPFDLLVDELPQTRDNGRPPLFDVLVAFHDRPLPVNEMPWRLPVSKYDLTFNIRPGIETIGLEIEYATPLFEGRRIDRLMDHLMVMMEAVCGGYTGPVHRLPMITASGEQRLLKGINTTERVLTEQENIITLIEERITSHPEKIAVKSSGLALSFQQVGDLSDRIAAALLDRKAALNEKVVAVLMERTALLPVIILAIQKTGAIYLPLDKKLPPERLNYFLTDTDTTILITDEERPGFTLPVLLLDNLDNLWRLPAAFTRRRPQPAQPAYLIYTSGSTGRPKGVTVSHRNLLNFTYGMQQALQWPEEKIHLLAVTSVSFDISLLELLWSISRGIQITIFNPEDTAWIGLNEELAKDINALQTTPSLLRMLLGSPGSFTFLQSLKYIIIGGEALKEELLARLRSLTNAKIYNAYGPTETTIWSSVRSLQVEKGITAGFPLLNTRIYIRDQQGNILPEGIDGEICIAGEGVSLGYKNNPALTAEKFTEDPLDRSRRMYATGDKGRWNFDGELVVSGRMDRQLKLDGHRVEPAEIENCLVDTGLVRQAAVAVRDRGEVRSLIAWIIADDGPDPAALSQALLSKLPPYMIPDEFCNLKVFPLTPNGKLDYAALPEPSGVRQRRSRLPFEGPRTEIQEELAGLVASVLMLDRVSIHDNFFELGGNSIKAVLLINKIRRRYPVPVNFARIYREFTVDRMGREIELGQLAGPPTDKVQTNVEKDFFML